MTLRLSGFLFGCFSPNPDVLIIYIVLAGKRSGENEKDCMGETGSCRYCGAVLCTHIFVTVIARNELREIDPAHADRLICSTFFLLFLFLTPVISV